MTHQPPSFLSDTFVEKIVDFFRESGEEIQNSPLAKRCSFLVRKANPYLSITIRTATFLVRRPPKEALAPVARWGFAQNQVKIM